MSIPTHTVCITAHYAPHRIAFLSTVLDAIAGWDGCATDVRLITDTDALERNEAISERAARYREAGSSLTQVVAEGLDDPFQLTWHHKHFLEPWRDSAGPGDLFVYLEDDMVLTAHGVRYFQRHRPLLEPFRLVPSFVRYEQLPGTEPVAVDLVRPEFYGHANSVRFDDQVAHVCRNPYWAGYILDRELATEHLGSPSFDMERSGFIGWDLRARAAMGVCFEDVPDGFRARHAVVLKDGRPVQGALVWHCANTYSAAGDPNYGRLPLEDAFVTGSALAFQLDRVRARLARLAPRRGAGSRGPSGP